MRSDLGARLNLLVLGLGKGSWQIRGEQLGAALGARITSAPTDHDYQWADLALIIKRAEPRFGPDARRHGVPIVWDALDCWRQPSENAMGPDQACQQLRNHIQAIKPALVLGATQAQATAASGVYLRHHSRPGLVPAPVRDQVRTVTYEGSPNFLGTWQVVLAQCCQRRGWQFLINPSDLREADLIVALRDGVWDGWACRQWKSGVKLVNALAAGRPVITQPSAAFDEIGPPGTLIETVADLEAALDAWTSYDRRSEALDCCQRLAPFYGLERVAADARQILQAVCCPA